jgi:hypothetical protein
MLDSGNLSVFIAKKKEHRGSGSGWSAETYKDAIVEYVQLRKYCKIEYSYYGHTLIMPPLYAPPSVTHRNKIYIRRSITRFEEDTIRHGYWKEYSPVHAMAEEGEYHHGEKAGLWKFYHPGGTLKGTEVYDYPSIAWGMIGLILAACAGLVALSTFLLKKMGHWQ